MYAEIQRTGHADKLAAGIVLTGGGSQLQNLVQLTEYVTGLDTRIGYPNEHLGKSKIEAVKSPMFATTVGLVLAGYRSLDERLNRNYEQEQQHQPQPAPYYQTPAPTPAPAPVPATKPVAQKPAGPKEPKKPSGAGKFFQDIISRTKGLLIDDFDDTKY